MRVAETNEQGAEDVNSGFLLPRRLSSHPVERSQQGEESDGLLPRSVNPFFRIVLPTPCSLPCHQDRS